MKRMPWLRITGTGPEDGAAIVPDDVEDGKEWVTGTTTVESALNWVAWSIDCEVERTENGFELFYKEDEMAMPTNTHTA